MIKKLIYIFGFILQGLLLWSCSDELSITTGGNENDTLNELPVEFNIIMPEDATRGFLNSDNVKRIFTNGDMIHILGTFQINYDDLTTGEKVEETVTRYGALRFNGIIWQAVEGSDLTWPSQSVSGQFKAYYISDSDGVLTPANPSNSYLLSEITPATDPLYASSEAGIAYGNGVPLKFYHLCAYLTLINMEPQVSDQFWFTSSGLIDADTHESLTFNNAFEIELGKDANEQPTLSFNFVQQQNSSYSNGVYIIGYPVKQTDDNGNEFGNPQVSFFLEPGYYETFDIVYPAGSSTTYPYLKYDYKNITSIPGGETADPIEPDLQGGVTYTLDITKSQGITISTPSESTDWDDSGYNYPVDVEDFLKAASSGQDYTYEDPDTGAVTTILRKTSTGVELLKNVDFRNFRYEDFIDKNFQPDLNADYVFEGGLHYIRNLADPLFRYNRGTIRNLGVTNVTSTIISYETSDNTTDNSRNGALCHLNEGQISNIRLYDVTLNVYVRCESENGSETHNIGGLVGSNTGMISEVSFSENFVINVTGLSSDSNVTNPPSRNYPVNAKVLIGGISGQNAGLITNVTTKTGFTLSINNSCVGNSGEYSVGGFVGDATGSLTEITMSNISIDCTKSQGVVSYLGGMAGQLQGSSESATILSVSDCTAGGSIKAGNTVKYGALTSGSYSGGLVGAVLNSSITGCYSAVAVAGSSSANSDVTYATGGVIGRVRSSYFYDFSSIIGYGNSLTGPTDYIGNFVGIAPDETGWTQWYNTFSSQNITVRKFNDYKDVGFPTTGS